MGAEKKQDFRIAFKTNFNLHTYHEVTVQIYIQNIIIHSGQIQPNNVVKYIEFQKKKQNM